MKKLVSVLLAVVCMFSTVPTMALAEEIVSTVRYGDVDSNGLVNMKDQSYLRKYLLTADDSSIDIQAADITKNGIVDSNDYLLLSKILWGVPGFDTDSTVNEEITAPGDCRLSFKTSEACGNNTSVTLSFSIEATYGVWACMFDVTYNSAILDLDISAYESSEMDVYMYIVSPGQARIFCQAKTSYDVFEASCCIEFELLTDCECTSLIMPISSSYSAINYHFEKLVMTSENAEIRISDKDSAYVRPISAVDTSNADHVCLGDVNFDNNINMKDVIRARQYLCGYESEDFLITAADTTKNGRFNSKDVLQIMKWVGGFINHFDEEISDEQCVDDNDCNIKIENVEASDQTVDVPARITSTKGIYSALIDFTYDTNVLEFLEAHASFTGRGFQSKEIAPGKVRVYCFGDVQSGYTWEDCILTFKVKGEPGTYSQLVATIPGDEDVIDCNYNNVPVTITNGEVQIVKAEVKPANHSVQVSLGTADQEILPAGEMVTVTAISPAPGMIFDKWVGDGVIFENANALTTRFIMPDYDVMIWATYKLAPYEVTVVGGTADKAEASPGSLVTVIATIPSGYAFDKWTGEGVFFVDATSMETTFTMPANDVTIEAVFTMIPMQSTSQTSQTQPSATESNITESSATESSATESSATESSTTESSATESSVTESSTTESSTTESSTTESSATESSSTDSTIQPTGEPSEKIFGDANGDNAINMKDVLLLRKYLADMTDDLDLEAADVNADGTVNMKDVLMLRKFLADVIDKLGA